MPISPARTAAFDILLRVERENAYASELLHAHHYASLSAADHALATELVMGVLRWRSGLDEQIAAHSSQLLQKLDLEVLIALRLAIYQLRFLDRVPQRAAVHESVELVKRARKRSAVAFVNAVLRKLAASSVTNPKAHGARGNLAEAAKETAHPLWLLERWQQEFGDDAVHKICDYDQQVPQTTVWLGSPEVEAELSKEGVELAPGRILTSARRVLSGDLTRTRAFREGRVFIQDEASQLVALLVGEGKHILDCCAAPGGKTRILASRNPDAAILAADLHPHRARLLRKLVPQENVMVVAADIRGLPVEKTFDCVLADVPCSGTGTLARNPEIKWRLNPEDLDDLRERQLEILRSAMNYVAPGGRLIYSTCSLEPEENAGVVEKALAGSPTFRLFDCESKLEKLQRAGELAWPDRQSLTNGPYLRTVPGVHPCDGFFAAILERN